MKKLVALRQYVAYITGAALVFALGVFVGGQKDENGVVLAGDMTAGSQCEVGGHEVGIEVSNESEDLFVNCSGFLD